MKLQDLLDEAVDRAYEDSLLSDTQETIWVRVSCGRPDPCARMPGGQTAPPRY